MSAEWTDPEERCPECGAGLLIERFENTRPHAPVRYCSMAGCEWSDHPELSPTCCLERDDNFPLSDYARARLAAPDSPKFIRPDVANRQESA